MTYSSFCFVNLKNKGFNVKIHKIIKTFLNLKKKFFFIFIIYIYIIYDALFDVVENNNLNAIVNYKAEQL